jgi:hypothetical protein
MDIECLHLDCTRLLIKFIYSVHQQLCETNRLLMITSWMPMRCYGSQSECPLVTEVRYHFFAGNIQIYSMNSQEVQDNPNIIKITLRSLDHLTTTTAARACRRRALSAPIPDSSWHCWWQSRNLRARVSKDQRPRAEIIDVEPLNWSEDSTRRIPTHLNAIGEIATNEVDEEARIPYSCPAQHRHSHHNNDVGRPNSNLGTLQQRRA